MVKKIVCLLLFFSSLTMYAQQEQNEKSPEEMALEEVAMLERDLKLTSTQTFYVDSILVSAYTKLKNDFDNLRSSGMQNPTTYKAVRDKCLESCKKAMHKVLDEQQYILYLRHIGQGREYKKGKDGKYYKKEDLKKK